MSINLDITQLTFPVSVLASYVDFDVKTTIVDCQNQNELDCVLGTPDFKYSIVPNDPSFQVYDEFYDKSDNKVHWLKVERVSFDEFME